MLIPVAEAKFRHYWPEPGSDNWGKGRVLVTTTDRNVVPQHNECADSYELPPLSEEEAIQLLAKVIGQGYLPGEGTGELVNSDYIKRIPSKIRRSVYQVQSYLIKLYEATCDTTAWIVIVQN